MNFNFTDGIYTLSTEWNLIRLGGQMMTSDLEILPLETRSETNKMEMFLHPRHL